MKKIGLIDNLFDIDSFRADRFYVADSTEIMRATGGNTGNVAFVFGTRKLLHNPVERLEWGCSASRIQQLDQLVICCANQIGKHVDLAIWADRLEKFGRPVTLLGLGAQADSYDHDPMIPDGSLRFLEVVRSLRPISHEPNIAVRGEFTQRYLTHLGHDSVVTSCPSLFISDVHLLGQRILESASVRSDRIAVAGGNPWHSQSAFIESTLIRIAEASRAYVVQHPESVVTLLRDKTQNFEPAALEHLLRVYHQPDLPALAAWFKSNAWDFADVPTWMRFLTKFDAVVGPRYHGVALGMQCGIPGCVYTIDSRTQELCDGTGIKSIPVSALKNAGIEDIVESARWTPEDADRFDTSRIKNAQACVSFLEANELVPSSHIRAIACQESSK